MNKGLVTTIADWHEHVNAALVSGAIVYSSSGSTGPSKSLPYTPGVFRSAVERTKQLCALLDMQPGDNVAILWGYGLFPPAQFYTMALSELGCSVYPLGSGKNLSTEIKITRMCDTPPDVIIGMPSYLLKVGRDMAEVNKLRKSCRNLSYLITGGEVLDDTLRSSLEHLFKVPVYDHYGMLQAPMIAGECVHRHCHVAADYTPEVITTDGKILPEGRGVLLLSSKTAWSPLNLRRLQTNDIIELRREGCACGFQMPWLRIFGRSDFVIKVRGQQIDFPSIFISLRSWGVDEYYFEIIKNPTDEVVLHVGEGVDIARVSALLSEMIAIPYTIKAHATFEAPQTNTGKPTRIVMAS